MNNFRDNIQLYYDFYVIAKTGNMSKAAEKIHTSQSNLSHRIQSLEDMLGLKLINSSNKGINLTTDGISLVKQLERETLSSMIEQDSNNNDEQGKIVIGTTRNIADNVLADYLCEYNQLYPNIEISILTDNASNLNKYMMEYKIDVMIDYLPQINFSEKYGFEIKAISEFDTCFACNKELYDNGAKDIKSIKDLQRFNLVLPGKSRRRQMLDSLLQEKNIKLSSKIEMPDSDLMVKFIQKRPYIGYFNTKQIDGSNLIKLTLVEKMPKNPFAIVYSKNINVSVQKFVDLISSRD